MHTHNVQSKVTAGFVSPFTKSESGFVWEMELSTKTEEKQKKNAEIASQWI